MPEFENGSALIAGKNKMVTEMTASRDAQFFVIGRYELVPADDISPQNRKTEHLVHSKEAMISFGFTRKKTGKIRFLKIFLPVINNPHKYLHYGKWGLAKTFLLFS